MHPTLRESSDNSLKSKQKNAPRSPSRTNPEAKHAGLVLFKKWTFGCQNRQPFCFLLPRCICGWNLEWISIFSIEPKPPHFIYTQSTGSHLSNEWKVGSWAFPGPSCVVCSSPWLLCLSAKPPTPPQLSGPSGDPSPSALCPWACRHCKVKPKKSSVLKELTKIQKLQLDYTS